MCRLIGVRLDDEGNERRKANGVELQKGAHEGGVRLALLKVIRIDDRPGDAEQLR